MEDVLVFVKQNCNLMEYKTYYTSKDVFFRSINSFNQVDLKKKPSISVVSHRHKRHNDVRNGSWLSISTRKTAIKKKNETLKYAIKQNCMFYILYFRIAI